jgi:flagellar hook protein FlgE
MALTSTLYTGLSGLDVNQTWLNVIGNNIANSNTTAFKASVANFQPQFYVTDASGTAASANFGGTNPSQTGMGAEVADISKNLTQGTLQSTGVASNLAVDGNGYFVVQGTSGQVYTRDGTFSLNNNNQLVTSSGQFVEGYGVDANGNVIQGALQNITIPIGQQTIAKATQNIQLQGNLDSAGTPAAGSSLYFSQTLYDTGGVTPTASTLLTNLQQAGATAGTYTSLGITSGETFTLNATKGTSSTTPKTFTVGATSTVGDLETFFNNTLGIDTTAPAPTGGVAPGVSLAQAAGDTSGARLQIVGNEGNDNSLTLGGSAFASASGASPFALTNTLTTTSGVGNNPSGQSVHLGVTAYDSLGTPVTVNVTAVLESTSSTGSVWRYFASSPQNQGGSSILGNGTLAFDTTGNLLTTVSPTVTLDRAGTGAVASQSITLDFSKVQALSSTSSTLVSPSQDGTPIGTLSSYSVGTDGTIEGSYNNGMTRTIGQVALATFSNPQGLIDEGGNDFAAGADSGQATISLPQQLGGGSIRSGTLEESNVDLSKEFTNMIVASSGFSAASKVITTANELISELLNSTR